MLDNMRLYDENEQQDLPKCLECGQECVLGYDDALIVNDEDYFCSVDCLLKNVHAKAV